MAERDRVEKVEIIVPPGMEEEFYVAATEAGWSDDPGTGKAIIIDDPAREDYGAEILNPTPMAPPVGYEPGDTLEDMVRRHMQKQINLLQLDGDMVIDETEEEADDFDIEDELPRSPYEVFDVIEEAPRLSEAAPVAAPSPAPSPAPPPPPAPENGEGA